MSNFIAFINTHHSVLLPTKMLTKFKSPYDITEKIRSLVHLGGA